MVIESGYTNVCVYIYIYIDLEGKINKHRDCNKPGNIALQLPRNPLKAQCETFRIIYWGKMEYYSV